jgi:hypothetical protein
MTLLNFGLGLCGKVRGSDPSVSQQQIDLAAIALGSFLRGDSSPYTTALAQLGALASTRLSTDEMVQIHNEEEKLVAGLPLPLKDWQELIVNMCWNKAKFNTKEAESEYQQFVKQNKEQKKS